MNPGQSKEPKRYEVREGSLPGDSKSILGLWDVAFEDLRGRVGAEHLNWMYRDNPGGAASIFFLHSSAGERVGFLGFGARRFSFRDRDITAGIMVDFVVRKEHRSLGPAVTLLKGGLKAREEALGFLYGFPNRSAQGVFKRAGYRPVTTVKRYARPLRSRRFLEKRLPGLLAALVAPALDVAQDLSNLFAFSLSRLLYSWEKDAEITGEFDQLWERGRSQEAITGIRSSKELHWRFFEAPRGRAVQVVTSHSKKTGSLVGYAVWRAEEETAIIKDIFTAGDAEVLRALLVFCARHARKRGCDSISMEFRAPGDMERAVRQAGFLAREEFEVFFVDGSAELGESDLEWYLTTFDRD